MGAHRAEGKIRHLPSHHIQDSLTIFNNNREKSHIVFNDIFNKWQKLKLHTLHPNKKINQITKPIILNATTDFLSLNLP